jgi:hypothetical protein
MNPDYWLDAIWPPSNTRFMKWPLQREAHARNEKVHNPDYREEMALEGDGFDRGGDEPVKQKQVFTLKGNALFINTSHPEFKTKAQIFLEHVLRRESQFRVGNYIAGLNWNKKRFCKHNGIQWENAEATFNEIRAELEEVFKITIKNLRQAEREAGSDEVVRNGVNKLCYSFKSGLIPTKIGSLETKRFVLDIDFFNAE